MEAITTHFDSEAQRDKVRRMTRIGETHFTCGPGSYRLQVDLPIEYLQTPRVFYSVRLNEDDSFGLIHNLTVIEKTHFIIALHNRYDSPIEGDIYWNSSVLLE